MAGREADMPGHVTGRDPRDAQAPFAVIRTTGTVRAARSILPRLRKPQDFYLLNPYTIFYQKQQELLIKSQEGASRKITHDHLFSCGQRRFSEKT